jgi:SAM-dependent methyltransferase
MGRVLSDMSDSPYARSFGARAESYHRYRPRYPAAAIDFVLDGRAPQRILDLGAGTGLLTRDLIGRAPEVLAVEPDEEMRAVLATTAPGAEVLAGSAERIPVPDASIDAVLVGQAFHWFSRPAADRELARVLRPGGVVGLLWNVTERKLGWVSRLYEATEQPAPPADYQASDLDETLFTPPREFRVEGERELPGPDGLIGLAHTWSWVISRTPDEQRRIDQRLRILISQYAELQRPVIRMPQLTRVIRQYLR